MRIKSSISLDILYLLGRGALTTAARRPEERGWTDGLSSGSIKKLTARSSVELMIKPPAVRGLRNLSFLPCLLVDMGQMAVFEAAKGMLPSKGELCPS